MKKNARTVVVCFLFLIILMIILGKVSNIVERKASYSKYMDFYEQEEEFDVLFLGSSHVLRGVFPMELWNDYGIVSYNMSNHAETLAETYWVLRTSLEQKKPKLVVIDLYKLPLNEKISKDEESGELLKEYLHDYMDAVPLSWTKVQAIFDLLPSEERMEFLFDFCMYHERWSSLGQSDFLIEKKPEKGAEAYAGIVNAEPPEKISTEQTIVQDTLGKQYLCKMIELCQQKGIDVLLTYIPYGGITSENRVWAKSAAAIAEKYGVRYENLLEIEGLLDYEVDCSDSNSHLNTSGGRKVTEYLGKVIREYYQIPDRRAEDSYKTWHEDYRMYMDEKIMELASDADIYTYLLRLNDQSMSCSCFIRPDSVIYEDELTMRLLHNLGNVKRLEEAAEKNEAYLLLVDNRDNRIYEFVGEEEFYDAVSFGLIEYGVDENGKRTLHIEYSEDDYLTDSVDRPSDLHVLVFDNSNSEMVDKARFIMKDVMDRKEIKNSGPMP